MIISHLNIGLGPRGNSWLLSHGLSTGHEFRFLTRCCTCVSQLVWFASRFKAIDSLMQDIWSQATHEQTGHDPLFLQPLDCHKDTAHSDTVFLQLQSWLCVRMFCKRKIFCESYMRIHVQMSPIIVAMKVWTVTSSQLVHTKNCDLLLIHWPHNFHTHYSSHLSSQFW